MIYEKHSQEVYKLLKRGTRILITGSRNYQDYTQFKTLVLEHLEKSLVKTNDLVFIAGGAYSGADKFIEDLCREDENLHLIVYPADWDKHKKAAGFIRNAEMVKVCTQTLAFWDKVSNGTKHAIDTSRESDIRTKVFIIKTQE